MYRIIRLNSRTFILFTVEFYWSVSKMSNPLSTLPSRKFNRFHSTFSRLNGLNLHGLRLRIKNPLPKKQTASKASKFPVPAASKVSSQQISDSWDVLPPYIESLFSALSSLNHKNKTLFQAYNFKKFFLYSSNDMAFPPSKVLPTPTSTLYYPQNQR